MDTSIRPATVDDLNGILLIYNHSIVNTTAVYHYDPFDFKQMEQWFAAKKLHDFPVFVAEIDREIAGFVTYGGFRPWPANKYTVEHSIHIHPNHQGKGVANALMPVMISAAIQQQFHTIIAGIDATNTASIELHKKFGFQPAGVLKKVGYKFDKWLDLSFMQLILPQPNHPNEKLP